LAGLVVILPLSGWELLYTRMQFTTQTVWVAIGRG
jgi:hypothetical protein